MKDDFNRPSPREHNMRMQFLTAAENGAIDMARDILYQGVLNAETLDRALGVAAAEGQVDFVKFLAEEVNMDLSRRGPEVLAQAVRDREVGVVDILTRSGDISLNPRGPLETHYLDLALVGGNPYSPELLQMLLERGAKAQSGGFDAINTALREGNADALRRFMKHDPHLGGTMGSRLVAAAMRLDPAAVKILLDNGAPAAYSDSAPLRGVTHQMLDVAGRDKQRIFECAELLLGKGGGGEEAENEMLKAAIRRRNAPLVRLLLERGADAEPEMRGIGYNKLVLAAAYGFDDLVEKFHRAGAETPDAYQEALAAAAEHGHARIVDQLIGYGADARKADIVFCAVVGGQLDLVRSLLARGYATDFREPVLLEAVIEGDHGKMLDFLFDQGADRSKAHELYIRCSNRDSKPYASIHATLKMWSERSMTIVYSIPEPHSLADLRAEEPDHQGFPQSLLVRMAKINRFGEAAALARAATDDRLEVRDLLKTDAAGNSVLEILGARKQLPALFAADLWESRQEDFSILYGEVAPVYRDQVDYQGLVSTWRRRTLASIRPLVPKLKKG